MSEQIPEMRQERAKPDRPSATLRSRQEVSTKNFSVNSVRGDMDPNKVCRCDTIKEYSDNNFHLNFNQFHVSTKQREEHSNPD